MPCALLEKFPVGSRPSHRRTGRSMPAPISRGDLISRRLVRRRPRRSATWSWPGGSRIPRGCSLCPEARPVHAIAVAAGNGWRSFSAPDTLVHLCDAQGVKKTVRMDELLPYAFVNRGDRMSAVVDVLIERLHGRMPRHAIVLGFGPGDRSSRRWPIRCALPMADSAGFFPRAASPVTPARVVAGHIGATR